MSLKEIDDAYTSTAKTILSRRGSKNVRCYQDGEYRIIVSVDPSGDNGEDEHHVSVSRKLLKPVTVSVARRYAKILFPRVSIKDWEHHTEKGQQATHLFSPVDSE